jgi:3-deoxy-D-arabino-heptulosonate 7-phosphate (DAHP) synthase class II
MYMREAPSSILGQNIDYLYSGFVTFYQSVQANGRILLWHADPLQGNGRESSTHTTAITE